MKNTAEQTKYRVETDGETPCLSGHGIIEVDAIDDTHAIVTVEGNGVMFEQHAATCDAIFGIEQIHDGTAILEAIEAGFAAGGKDEWDAPEFANARELTEAAGCVWDFDGWRDTADCIRQGCLGGTVFA
jgi:hypothetical protein